MRLICVFPLVLLLQSRSVFGEMFTAMNDMEGLVTAELELLRHLDNYIQAEETRILRLKRYVHTILPNNLIA